MNRNLLSTFTMAALLGLACQAARADYVVQVGYADNVRSSPFFPDPWQGGAGVDTFAGAGDPGNPPGFDAGAIRVINTGSTAITFNGLTVDSFGDGASFALWTGYAGDMIQPGDSMIFTQTGTSFENFDTSDHEGGNSAAIPRVLLTIDNVQKTFLDTAQVLNTEGTDHLAVAGENESHQWREIGTFGGQAGDVPDVGSTLSLLGMACTGIAFLRRRAA
jgi:hypothetical protein